jgi:hypothetical protein
MDRVFSIIHNPLNLIYDVHFIFIYLLSLLSVIYYYYYYYYYYLRCSGHYIFSAAITVPSSNLTSRCSAISKTLGTTAGQYVRKFSPLIYWRD